MREIYFDFYRPLSGNWNWEKTYDSILYVRQNRIAGVGGGERQLKMIANYFPETVGEINDVHEKLGLCIVSLEKFPRIV